MKRVTNQFKFLSLLIVFLCASPYFLEAQEVQKEILRNFQIGQQGQITVTHKNGNIQFRTWEHNRVMVKAIITVKGGNAQEYFRNITVDAKQQGNKLELKTNAGVFEKPEPQNHALARKSDKYHMDYVITVPKDASLLVNQKFGDLSLGEFQGPISLDLSHGKIDISELKGTADLTFNYINGSIKKLNKVYLEAHRSNLHFVSANHINIRSAYSEFQIDEADSLISSHKHNDFDISTVAYLKMDEEYSAVKVANLTQKGDLSLNYGDFAVEKLSPKLSNLNLFGELTDFTIKTENTPAYSVDIDSKETLVNLPKDLIILNKQNNQPQLKSITQIQGVKNSNHKDKPKIVIVTKEGEVTLE